MLNESEWCVCVYMSQVCALVYGVCLSMYVDANVVCVCMVVCVCGGGGGGGVPFPCYSQTICKAGC